MADPARVEALVAEFQRTRDSSCFAKLLAEMTPQVKARAGRFSPGHEYDDRYQRYAMALHRAAAGYDSSTGVPFTAWFQAAAENEFKQMWKESRSQHRAINYETASLEGLREVGVEPPESPDEGGDDPAFPKYGYVELRLAMESLSLTERERQVAEGFAKGMRRREVARSIGVGDSRVGDILRQLKKKFAKAGITLHTMRA